MNTGCKGFCGGKDEVLRIKFLSFKASGVGAALALSLCVELRVTGGKFGIWRRIFVIISPATLTTLVGHLRGGDFFSKK
jgi:hypothetical protein